jgi:hypothetical protein
MQDFGQSANAQELEQSVNEQEFKQGGKRKKLICFLILFS